MDQKGYFLQDPQDRPTAGELLQDQWILQSRKTLRMSWRKSANLARKGLKPQAAHRTLSSVVERMLERKGGQGGPGDEAAAAQTVDPPPLPPLPRSRRDVSSAHHAGDAAPRRPSEVHLRLPSQLVRSISC
jgi:hypothetical protein